MPINPTLSIFSIAVCFLGFYEAGGGASFVGETKVNVQGEASSMRRPDANACDDMFQGFTPLAVERMDFPLGHLKGIRSPVYYYTDYIELDGRGLPERVFISERGQKAGRSDEPYSVVFVVRPENKAYTDLSVDAVAALHDVKKIRSSEDYGFDYLSFGNGFERFSLRLSSGEKVEAAGVQDLEAYLRATGVLDLASDDKLPTLKAVIASVGEASGQILFRLSAKPMEFDGDGRLKGYDGSGLYIGRHFEFLAKYYSSNEFEIICMREIPQ